MRTRLNCFAGRSGAFVIVALLVLGGLPALLCAASLESEAQSALDEAREVNNLVGLSAAVAVDGKIVWSGGSGFANVENEVPARAAMVHRITSISKPLTAVAVMQLVEAGKVDLDADIHSYLPAFPKKPWPITTRQLLGHQSGVRHYRPGEAGTMQNFRWLEDAMAVFQDDDLKFEPGTDYQYTTYGYTILGAIVEAASGQRFGEYMREHVWDPAGMASTRLEIKGEIVQNRASGYSLDRAGKLNNAKYTDLSVKYPGGGILSTVGDLVRFAHAFDTGKLVSAQTRDAMLVAGEVNGENTNYGLGLGVSESEELGPAFSHSGGQAGTTTLLIFFREPEIGVAVFSNRDRSGGLRELAGKLARMVKAEQATADGR